MYPILINFHGVVIPSWHLLFAVGTLLGYSISVWLWGLTNSKVSRLDFDLLFLCCYCGSYFGARAFSILMEGGESWSGLWQIGAMAFYGGLLGGLALGGFYVWRRHLPVWDMVDLGMPGLFFALFVGRIGCLLNGCDFGRPVALAPGTPPPFWALVNPVLHDGAARYPTQLMESFIALCLAICGIAIIRQKGRLDGDGRVGLALVTGYAVARFFLEYLRGDTRGWVIEEQISSSQGVSLVILSGVAALLLWRLIMRRRNAAPTTEGDG